MEIERKEIDARIEVKESREDGSLHIRAYACAFGNIDSQRDIILPTACDKFLAGEFAKRMALCYQHDIHTIIGKISDKGVDDYGMWIEADILPTQVGKDVITLMKAGALSEFSIGYIADKWTWDEKQEIRMLDEITIYEVSPVTIASNPKAVLVSAKSDESKRESKETEVQEQAKTIDLASMSDDELNALYGDIEQEQYKRVLENL